MGELITLCISLHRFFIGTLLVMMLLNLYWLKSETSFFKLSKKLELLSPQYYVVLSTIFFTGIIVMAVKQFHINLSVSVMIIVWLWILFTSIKLYKVYKRMDKTHLISQEAYKKSALQKYMMDIVVVFMTLFFLYGVV